MRQQRAFSLIELLVVLGILSLLAALLYPVFATAREKGRTTRCLTQLRQLAQSTQMYLADFDNTYPLAAFFQHPQWTALLLHALSCLSAVCQRQRDCALLLGPQPAQCGGSGGTHCAFMSCDGLSVQQLYGELVLD